MPVLKEKKERTQKQMETEEMKTKVDDELLLEEVDEMMFSPYINSNIIQHLNYVLEGYWDDGANGLNNEQRSKINNIKRLLENCEKVHKQYSPMISEILVYTNDKETRKLLEKYLNDDYFLTFDDLNMIQELYQSIKFKNLVDSYLAIDSDEGYLHPIVSHDSSGYDFVLNEHIAD